MTTTAKGKAKAKVAETAGDKKVVTSLAKYIRERRDALKKSQGQVASAVGQKTPEWLGMVESGARPLQLEHAMRLADALQIDRHDFAKIVLQQYYPTIFSALFPKNATRLQETIDDAHETSGEVYPAQVAMDLYEKIHALPQNVRTTLINMIDHTFAMHVTNTRGAR
jgi:transcriptional regulator with XRE-family HTH domain